MGLSQRTHLFTLTVQLWVQSAWTCLECHTLEQLSLEGSKNMSTFSPIEVTISQKCGGVQEKAEYTNLLQILQT